jgi:UDP-glucose 4-epimerase
MLSQAIRRLGRPSVAVPPFAMAPVGSLFRQARYADLSPDQRAFLTYGRGIDTSEMRDVLGFEAKYTTAAALDAFAARLRPGMLAPQRLSAIEERLNALVSATSGESRG